MKWYRLLLVVMALGLLVSCKNPNAPRYPEQEEDTGQDPEKPTQGFTVSELGVYWV